jgi:hypothetical protein
MKIEGIQALSVLDELNQPPLPPRVLGSFVITTIFFLSNVYCILPYATFSFLLKQFTF